MSETLAETAKRLHLRAIVLDPDDQENVAQMVLELAVLLDRVCEKLEGES